MKRCTECKAKLYVHASTDMEKCQSCRGERWHAPVGGATVPDHESELNFYRDAEGS